MKKIEAALFCLLALVGVTSIHAAPPVPTGVFYLPSNVSLDEVALNNPNVDGVVVGAKWSDLEPNDGEYVFNSAAQGQSLQVQLELVEESNNGNGKPMRLAIATGGPGASAGGSKPDWLIDLIGQRGGKFFTYLDEGSEVTIPVFWDPTLLNRHRLLVEAVADYLEDDHPLVKIVFVPYANAETNDWNLGDTDDDEDGIRPRNSTPQSRWLHTLVDSPYDTMADALIEAGKQTYEAYHTFFPDKILTTSIGRLENYVLNPGAEEVHGRNISETVVSNAAEAWPGYIVAQKNNLNGGSVPPAEESGDSAWNDLYILHTEYNSIPTAAQMVWRAYNDCAETEELYFARRMNAGKDSPCENSTQMLYQAVNTGITYETKWQEIYEADILHLGSENEDPNVPPDVPPNVIRYAHQQLVHQGP